MNLEGIKVQIESLEYSFSIDTKRNTLHNVSLDIQSGSFSALIGPSGAGKSTLGSLISGVIRPDKGRVLLNDVNAHDFVVQNPGSVAYVAQKPFVYHGSVQENIAFGVQRDQIDLTRVEEILKKVNLLERLGDSLSSFDKILDEQSLSGGQVQRLGIARALYKNPQLLILDEPTSSQDADTEAELLGEILDLKEKCTLFVIAHRLSTIRNADQIFLLESGEITYRGKFADLIESSELVARQVDLLKFE